ncbi:hypothetical protein [Breoghania sp.]|uniref:hypothetical protein n=1 Tax=Breoghania sp. TaxID=2065378 RepID=UPI002611BA71|nr:hypothetical protein [Breoghania sp.]MDJ0929702.1 hypothetical protein [Breoghania sp.]
MLLLAIGSQRRCFFEPQTGKEIASVARRDRGRCNWRLYLGWIDYKLTAGYVRAGLRKRKPGQAAPVADWLERNTDVVLGGLFVIAMLGFPVIGYLAGASLAG